MRSLNIIVFLIIFCSCVNAEHHKRILLNGSWHFIASNQIDENQVLSSNIEWDTMPVPSNWDTHEKYSDYVGKAYYQREFEIPKTWNGKQVRIKFGAVYQTSKVWVNGVLLGNHIGGYTPFEFNITALIKYNKTNTVTVMADNTYQRGAWWAWGGISRDVSLVCNEVLRIKYQHIEAVPNFETQKIQFRLKYKIENNAPQSTSLRVNSLIGDAIHKTLHVLIPGNQTTIKEISFERDLSEFKLWDYETPNLYTLTSKLIVNNKVYDTVKNKFGIRKLEAKGEQLFLNNKAVRMNGLNRVHDHPDYGNTEIDRIVKADMLDIKSLGAIFSRLMHSPQAPNLLDFCDSIGYLVIEEIPVWGEDDPQSFKDNPLTKKWLHEMIERDFNHPCVVAWSVGNELRQNDDIAPWGKKSLTTDQFEYINSMLDYVESLDTTRLKTYVSLTTYQSGSHMKNEPYDKLDFICINSYSNGVFAAKKTNEKFPGKPIFLSEIGLKQIGPAPEGILADELIDQLIALKDLPYVVGSALWCYNDYRSRYKGTPASGFREWGLVDEKRNKKAAYKQYKELYTK